ncbi:MAG: hypothetical protein NZ741_04175, partial [Armatimonadetes bacterium]|nr:hypothetical protein [Armatimonadota bacterium]
MTFMDATERVPPIGERMTIRTRRSAPSSCTCVLHVVHGQDARATTDIAEGVWLPPPRASQED